MHGVVTIGDWDEEVEDVPLIFFIPFGSLPSSLPFCVPSIGIFHPVLVGFFKASHIHLMLCQIFAPLLEYLKLFLIVMADFLIFARNSSQSTHDEDEFLHSHGSVSFKSGTYRVGGELQLTELCRSGSNGLQDQEGFLSVDHWGLSR